MSEPVKISPGFYSGSYHEFSNINGDPLFILHTQSKQLMCPETIIVNGRPKRPTKPVKVILKDEVLKETIIYIKSIIDNIKTFTKYASGSREKRMIRSIIQAYRTGTLNMVNHIKKGDKEKYYKDLEKWMENLKRSGGVTMKITRETSYYFANTKGEEISVSTGREGLWGFPISCKIVFTINAISGYLPVPYFKIKSITFLKVSEQSGLNIVPRHFIIKYHKYEKEQV